MIETPNAAINVHELMERVRQEAARIASQPRDAAAKQSGRGRTALSFATGEVLAPPPLALSNRIDPQKDRSEERLKKTRRMLEVSSSIPKFLRSFFRRQGGFNHAALDTLAGLVKTNLQLQKRVRELADAAEQQNQFLKALANARQSDLNAWQADLTATEGKLQEQFGVLRDELAVVRAANGEMQGHIDRAGEHLRNVQGDADRNAQRLNDLRQMLIRLEEREVNEAIYIKGELSRHNALLQQRLQTPNSANAAAAEQVAVQPDEHRLDTFYLAFENRFRGERAEIKRRVAFYLPIVQEAGAGIAGRPILDVACGRGEWLELLRDNGLEASGVDLSVAMAAQCRERGLPVAQADAIAHLRTLPDDSVGAVSGFHIIEHLPLEALIDLFSETRRVLAPGGVAFFESPNCENLVVGACNFNGDPTHRNPVFPKTAAFMMETQGFEQVELKYLSPVDTTNIEGSADLPPVLQRLLYGPQDFAVVARKPRAG